MKPLEIVGVIAGVASLGLAAYVAWREFRPNTLTAGAGTLAQGGITRQVTPQGQNPSPALAPAKDNTVSDWVAGVTLAGSLFKTLDGSIGF